jgi:hypothetical protein
VPVVELSGAVIELSGAKRAALEELLGEIDAVAGVEVPGATGYAVFRRTSTGRRVLSGLLIGSEAITADMLRRVPVARLEELVNWPGREALEEIEALPPLRRSSAPDPEEFSRLVAHHYLLWAQVVANPAAKMADRAGAKLPTVHGWIREARLRGLLPAAKRGKAQ